MKEMLAKPLQELIDDPIVWSIDVPRQAFCEHTCPQQAKHGNKFDWSKHCGHYIGERACAECEKFVNHYYKAKSLSQHKGG